MSVFLNNLDDFIVPSQACINPFITGSDASTPQSSRISLKADNTITEFEEVVQPNLIKSSTSLGKKIATVSLNDCLACSGCVTSAETVLIQQQSNSAFLGVLSSHAHRVVVCLSPQSVASIASFCESSGPETFLRIASILKKAGVEYVVDSSSAGDVALLETAEDFIHRYRQGRNDRWFDPPVFSTAQSSTAINILSENKPVAVMFGKPPTHPTDGSSSEMHTETVGPPSLSAIGVPVLVSACPGWVCYAEKTQPQALPSLSAVKSAQQILGALLKKKLFSAKAVEHGDPLLPFFVVSVQPCFDKKLEASRKDFFDEASHENEVDLVLSTTELLELIQTLGQASTTPKEYSNSDIDPLEILSRTTPDSLEGRDEVEKMLRSFSEFGRDFVSAAESKNGSGGYIEFVSRYAAEKLFQKNIWNSPLECKLGRNPDMAELLVHRSDAATSKDGVLRFARCYGFRNIQSLLLKMKRRKCEFDFVEVMACPSGCVNGGGQLKTSAVETPAQTKARVEGVTKAFTAEGASDDLVVRRPEDSPLVQWLYSDSTHWPSGESNSEPESRSKRSFSSIPPIGLIPLSEEARMLLHTRFHAIPKLEVVAPLAAKW